MLHRLRPEPRLRTGHFDVEVSATNQQIGDEKTCSTTSQDEMLPGYERENEGYTNDAVSSCPSIAGGSDNEEDELGDDDEVLVPMTRMEIDVPEARQHMLPRTVGHMSIAVRPPIHTPPSTPPPRDAVIEHPRLAKPTIGNIIHKGMEDATMVNDAERLTGAKKTVTFADELCSYAPPPFSTITPPVPVAPLPSALPISPDPLAKLSELEQFAHAHQQELAGVRRDIDAIAERGKEARTSAVSHDEAIILRNKVEALQDTLQRFERHIYGLSTTARLTNEQIVRMFKYVDDAVRQQRQAVAHASMRLSAYAPVLWDACDPAGALASTFHAMCAGVKAIRRQHPGKSGAFKAASALRHAFAGFHHILRALRPYAPPATLHHPYGLPDHMVADWRAWVAALMSELSHDDVARLPRYPTVWEREDARFGPSSVSNHPLGRCSAPTSHALPPQTNTNPHSQPTIDPRVRAPTRRGHNPPVRQAPYPAPGSAVSRNGIVSDSASVWSD